MANKPRTDEEVGMDLAYNILRHAHNDRGYAQTVHRTVANVAGSYLDAGQDPDLRRLENACVFDYATMLLEWVCDKAAELGSFGALPEHAVEDALIALLPAAWAPATLEKLYRTYDNHGDWCQKIPSQDPIMKCAQKAVGYIWRATR